ncbi:hypothetical protein SE17_40160, partial [Kouleothrix aurantiaca]
ALLAALGVALAISIYSVIDGAAVQLAAPLPYTIAVFLATVLALTPVMLRRYHPATLAAEWRANWPRILVTGGLVLLGYAMVLASYRAGRVGYAGAIREVSVVFAALIGWRWLGEGFGRTRIVGALLIFAGILMIAALG